MSFDENYDCIYYMYWNSLSFDENYDCRLEVDMRVMYEGIGSPCDECMYECGSSSCDAAESCAELVVVEGSIKYHESVFYYHVS